MSDTNSNLRIDFLESTIQPRGHGRGGREIVVARKSAEAANDQKIVAAGLAATATRAIILTDPYKDTNLIATILNPIKPAIAGEKPLRILFGNDKDITANFSKEFAAALQKRTKGKYSLPLEFTTLLKDDVMATVASTQPLFADSRVCFDLTCFGEDKKLFWRFDAEEEDFAICLRPLSRAGTLIAFQDHTRMEKMKNGGNEEYLKAYVDRCAHAGQGLYVVKGGTIHSSPDVQVDRWVYSLHPCK